MPIFVYDCECGNSIRQLSKSGDVICSKCDSVMKKNILKSVKHQSNDRVPGGYDEMVLNDWIGSEEGVAQETAYLSGDETYAY